MQAVNRVSYMEAELAVSKRAHCRFVLGRQAKEQDLTRSETRAAELEAALTTCKLDLESAQTALHASEGRIAELLKEVVKLEFSFTWAVPYVRYKALKCGLIGGGSSPRARGSWSTTAGCVARADGPRGKGAAA